MLFAQNVDCPTFNGYKERSYRLHEQPPSPIEQFLNDFLFFFFMVASTSVNMPHKILPAIDVQKVFVRKKKKQEDHVVSLIGNNYKA